ncbi:unnamed protein product [Heterobilharzia americana]|nr:unnamed protein product [Heterobilharzia americana]
MTSDETAYCKSLLSDLPPHVVKHICIILIYRNFACVRCCLPFFPSLASATFADLNGMDDVEEIRGYYTSQKRAKNQRIRTAYIKVDKVV